MQAPHLNYSQTDLPKMEKMGFSPGESRPETSRFPYPIGWFIRLFLLVTAIVVWAMFIILPLLSAAVADFHGIAIHGTLQNLTYSLIGFNYIGGLYALHELELTISFIWVCICLLTLAFWY